MNDVTLVILLLGGFLVLLATISQIVVRSGAAAERARMRRMRRNSADLRGVRDNSRRR